MSNQDATENLFSYGTLQLEAVQIATFQRLLQGAPDLLSGFVLAQLAIDDAQVVSTSGAATHPIAKHTGNPVEQIKGTVFRITAQELALADGYEVAGYQRVSVTLASGLSAAPRRFVWKETFTMTAGRRARWACGQAAIEPVHMSTGRSSSGGSR